MEDEDIAFLLQEAHRFVRADARPHLRPARVGEKIKDGQKGRRGVRVGRRPNQGVGIRVEVSDGDVFITLLIVALYLKIRQIEGK